MRLQMRQARINEGRVRTPCRAGLAAVPARVPPCRPGVDCRRAARGPRARRPHLVPDGRRQDGGVPRPRRDRDLPPAARRTAGRRRDGRDHPLHAAPPDRAAVPAGRVADLCDGAAAATRSPRRQAGAGHGAVLDRALGGQRGHAWHSQRGEGAWSACTRRRDPRRRTSSRSRAARGATPARPSKALDRPDRLRHPASR